MAKIGAKGERTERNKPKMSSWQMGKKESAWDSCAANRKKESVEI